jgi:hypothetical protein
MPKQDRNFFAKVRIIFRFLTKNTYGLSTTCGWCDSSAIVRLGSNQEKTQISVYMAEYKCMNCGSKAIAKEIWRKNEEGTNDD